MQINNNQTLCLFVGGGGDVITLISKKGFFILFLIMYPWNNCEKDPDPIENETDPADPD